MLKNNIEVSTTKTYINLKGGNIKPRFLYKLPNNISLKIRNPFYTWNPYDQKRLIFFN